MDKEGKFWISFWAIVATLVIAFIGTIASCTTYQNSLIRDMVAAGADPIDARCSISTVESQNPICVARVAARAK